MKHGQSVRKFALAAAVVACGLGGNALAEDIGILNPGQNPFLSTFRHPQFFDEIVTFTLPEGAARLSSVVTGMNLPEFASIQTELDGTQLLDGAFNFIGGGGTLFTVLDVPAGTYHLNVIGETLGDHGGGYFGSIDITPVPEPGPWTMLLAGLGVVGLASARKMKA